MALQMQTFIRDALDYNDDAVPRRQVAKVLRAWRQVAKFLRAARPDPFATAHSVSYYRARFLAQLMRSEYARHLNELWGWLLRMATGSSTSIRVIETFHVAHTHMPFPAVKMCSYSGAVVRVKNRKPQHWQWYDPGNWCYATIWYLLWKVARHWQKTTDQDPRSLEFMAACRLLQSMTACEYRWPRQWPAFYELAGDLFEMLLARGYCSTELEHVIDDFSLVTDKLLGIYRSLRSNHSQATPHIEPYLFADALLSARSGHRSGQWETFNRLIRLRPEPRASQPQ